MSTQEVFRWPTETNPAGQAMRGAVVISPRAMSYDVEPYLPENYVAVEVGNDLMIVGRDVAGWTLNDYVLPRLASGLIIAEEVALAKLPNSRRIGLAETLPLRAMAGIEYDEPIKEGDRWLWHECVNCLLERGEMIAMGSGHLRFDRPGVCSGHGAGSGRDPRECETDWTRFATKEEVAADYEKWIGKLLTTADGPEEEG